MFILLLLKRMALMPIASQPIITYTQEHCRACMLMLAISIAPQLVLAQQSVTITAHRM